MMLSVTTVADVFRVRRCRIYSPICRWILKMPQYYAVYRVLEQETDSKRIQFRAEHYDVHPIFNDTDRHFLSYAYELDDLDATQLGELQSRVRKNYPIHESEGWGAVKEEYGTIFLIEGSIQDHIAEEVGDVTKLKLKDMRERYVEAKTNRHFFEIIKPLTCCINTARRIRKEARLAAIGVSVPDKELTAIMKRSKLGPPPTDSPLVKSAAKSDATIDTRSTQREKYDSLDNEGKKATKQNAALYACKKANLHINIVDIEILFGLPEKSLNRAPYRSIIDRGRSKERQERDGVRKRVRKDRTRRGKIPKS